MLGRRYSGWGCQGGDVKGVGGVLGRRYSGWGCQGGAVNTGGVREEVFRLGV